MVIAERRRKKSRYCTLTWHDEPLGWFDIKPWFTVRIIVQFVDKLKLDWHLSCVGYRNTLALRFNKHHIFEV
jgi:hypothetical protein